MTSQIFADIFCKPVSPHAGAVLQRSAGACAHARDACVLYYRADVSARLVRYTTDYCEQLPCDVVIASSALPCPLTSHRAACTTAATAASLEPDDGRTACLPAFLPHPSTPLPKACVHALWDQLTCCHQTCPASRCAHRALPRELSRPGCATGHPRPVTRHTLRHIRCSKPCQPGHQHPTS